jgi:hypothetical protein
MSYGIAIPNSADDLNTQHANPAGKHANPSTEIAMKACSPIVPKFSVTSRRFKLKEVFENPVQAPGST